MPNIKLEVKRLDNSIELPAYAYPGDAGLDLRVSQAVTIHPFERVLLPTGFAIAIPEGYAGFVLPRSGMAYKRGLSIPNTPGLIDSHYRGELKVCAINLNPDTSVKLETGERVAQLVILPTPFVELVEVDELNETVRGAQGFGSSGTS